MPYAMRHTVTGTLLACAQRNGYELAYYGLLLWEEAPGEAEKRSSLVRAGVGPGHPAADAADWEAVLLSGHETKMANVKLRNDPRRTVRFRDGRIEAESSTEQ